jgi:glycosyltransferase involved in cell wall biosynthesis
MSGDVAIVVIAYNEERRIGHCLDALLAQKTDVPYDVIVVDDASADLTAEVVRSFQDSHPNLTLLQHEVNMGRGAARRTGQDSADSQWIGFVDADIVVPENWIDRCLQELADADGVSGIAQPDGDCAVLWRICEPALRDRPGSAEITGNNVIFSRSALAVVPFSPSAKLGEDFRLAKLMTQAGLRLRTVNNLKVVHRETKSYWSGVLWMWESGVDATSLPFEFRIVRLADLAWLAWLASVVTCVVLAALGGIGAGLAAALAAAVTLVIDIAFVFSRFTMRARPLRFLAALAISPPMMLAYLAGRTAGLFRVSQLLRRQSAPVL